jgi:hypothetical protein
VVTDHEAESLMVEFKRDLPSKPAVAEIVESRKCSTRPP